MLKNIINLLFNKYLGLFFLKCKNNTKNDVRSRHKARSGHRLDEDFLGLIINNCEYNCNKQSKKKINLKIIHEIIFPGSGLSSSGC